MGARKVPLRRVGGATHDVQAMRGEKGALKTGWGVQPMRCKPWWRERCLKDGDGDATHGVQHMGCNPWGATHGGEKGAFKTGWGCNP